jgi:alkanesulfonate monooxygenase SsuD/methylene tetrahydromethanopterin reductase-like flavin-dependent oxidoreductase (luciferase family)
MDVGVGLWTMRSTASRPELPAEAYRQLLVDAQLAEQLGFHSLWIAEHHFWYDGWCPATVTACAAVLGATTRLVAGTGIHLLSLWEPDSAASAAETAMQLSGGRLELGVGLGYRDEEFDGFAIPRGLRGRRMDTALDCLRERWQDGGPPLLVGGFSEAALARAASRGLGLFLPFSLSGDRLRRTIARYREYGRAAGRSPARIAMLKYVGVTNGSASAATQAAADIASSMREYSGAWFELDGQSGFQSPELLDRQFRLATDTALIGTSTEIMAGLNDIEQAGVDLVVLQITRDDVTVDHRDAMRALATVLPATARR